MLRLKNLSIGTKLILTSALGVLLMAGMMASMMIGNAGVRGAIDDTMTGESITQAASDSRASIRVLGIGLRDVRLALSLDAPAKPMAAKPARCEAAPVRKAATIAAAVSGRRGGPVARMQAGLATAMAEESDWKEF